MSKEYLNKIKHFDNVGSYLRPAYLLEARSDCAEGKITKEELTEIEDKAILDLIKKQEEAGLKVITDGEFRRASWHLDFFAGFNGAELLEDDDIDVQFAGVKFTRTVRINGKLSNKNHPFVDHVKFVLDNVSDDSIVKLTIPAPAQFIQESRRVYNIEHTKKYYDTLEEFVDDVVKAYSDAVQEIYDAGCRVLQLDDCTWGRLVSGKHATGEEMTEEELEELKELYLSANNAVINNAPEDLIINTHVCRGNFRSTWFSSGSYGPVADPLFSQQNVDTYYLEFDTERAGGFEPLAKVSEGKSVVLGLITTKEPELEDKDEVIARIKQASEYVPLENLGVGGQCGFSSNDVGNELTEEDQWAKIKLIREVAQEVWGN